MADRSRLEGFQSAVVRGPLEFPVGMSGKHPDPSFPVGSDIPANVGKMSNWVLPLVALGISCVATAIILLPTISSLITVWRTSSTYSYGFIILPICGLLAWNRRRALAYVQPASSKVALTIFAMLTLLWLIGNVADVQLVQHIALVGMLDSLVWLFLGNAVARILCFPLLFMFFSVPFGESLVAPLQRWTAAFTVAALRLSGIPAFQDGLALYTPSGSWQVAEACSGIRYLIASMVIGVLVAGVAYRSWPRRIAFLVFSALLPIVANALRAYGIVALAYVSGNAIAVGVDHIIYGFVFFSIITVILMVVAIRGAEPFENETAASNTRTSVNSVGAASLIISLSSVILLLVAARGLADHLWSRIAPPVTTLSYDAPAGWAPTRELDREWAPEPFKVESRNIQSFAMGTKTVSTAIGWYSSGRRGVELINSTNSVGKSGVWTVLSSDTRQVNIDGNSTLVVQNTVAHGPLRRLVWMWYSIDSQRVSDPYRLRAIQTRDRFQGRPRNVAFVAVSAPYNLRSSEASEVLQEFLK